MCPFICWQWTPGPCLPFGCHASCCRGHLCTDFCVDVCFGSVRIPRSGVTGYVVSVPWHICTLGSGQPAQQCPDDSLSHWLLVLIRQRLYSWRDKRDCVCLVLETVEAFVAHCGLLGLVCTGSGFRVRAKEPSRALPGTGILAARGPSRRAASCSLHQYPASVPWPDSYRELRAHRGG